jgi:pimeloyl-ACP methyl ester carboxylesterase
MPTITSGDAQLMYEVAGSGPDLVLLHPFPLNRRFWDGLLPELTSRYRVILPDLRAHGDSDAGDGPVTMGKLADDLAKLCREESIARARFVGVSIGGYALFEFWRRCPGHVLALVLANTRAGAENAEGRANRLQIADRVLREGTATFVDELVPKLMSPATRANRPDIVEAARGMAQRMSAGDVAAVQRGMADRPDSIPILSGINVPTLVIAGEDDSVPLAQADLMRRSIPGAHMQCIDHAGHYAAMEKPSEFAALLRGFLDGLPRT